MLHLFNGDVQIDGGPNYQLFSAWGLIDNYPLKNKKG